MTAENGIRVPQAEDLVVTGEAIRSGPPESVEIFATVIATGSNVIQPLQNAGSRIQAIGQAALAAGVPAGDIQVTALGVQPLYSAAAQAPAGAATAASGTTKPASETSPLAGYQAIHSIQVMIRDLNRMGSGLTTILEAANGPGTLAITSLSYRVRDETSLKLAVLQAATEDALLRARTLATALGRKLGKSVAAMEEYVGVPGNPAMAGTAGGAAGLPGTLTGLHVHARVRIRCELAQ